MAKLLFTGSDVLYATRLIGGIKFPTKWTKYLYFAAMTVFVKIADLFVECHYVVSDHLIRELQILKLKKQIKVLVDPPADMEGIERKPHKGINILYYCGKGGNQKFKNWVYGKDIVEQFWVRNLDEIEYCLIKDEIEYISETDGIRIIEVNGSADMKKIYPFVDFYIRPNRHDGAPRMIMECQKLGIPYYWSKENPSLDIMERRVKEFYNGIS